MRQFLSSTPATGAGPSRIPVALIHVWALAFFLTAPQSVHPQSNKGHRVVGEARVIVSAKGHWQNWGMPTHAVEVTSAGVKPKLFRDRYNVLDDLKTFSRKLPDLIRRNDDVAILNIDSTVKRDPLGEIITQKRGGRDVPVYVYFVKPGISRVGSNPDSAANILDGIEATCWEPDSDDPIERWWIEVDLGRTVPVDSLVLKFADEGRGDPFRQFRVLTSLHQEPVTQNARQLQLQVVGGTDKPNTARTFSVPLQDNLEAAPGWTGRMVETIRIVVTDTKGSRHTEISEAEWAALDDGDRGDVLYFVKDSQGVEEPIEKDEYNRLPAARQGRRDYYRSERPHLADIEVWGFGDNISPNLLEGGGNFSLLLPSVLNPPPLAFDGDFSTYYDHEIAIPGYPAGILTVDLGATFWLDVVRVSAVDIIGLPCKDFDGYIHRSSDGSRDVTGGFNLEPLSPLERTENSVNNYKQFMDVYDPPRQVRFLEMKISTIEDLDALRNTSACIAEYGLFSRGYVAEAVLTSDLIEIPSGSTPARISWVGDTPPGTDLEIRTRTGDILGKEIRYYNKNTGHEIDLATWNRLLNSWRTSDTTFVPTVGWSAWSRNYEHPGVPVTSPGGRKFLQLQVKLKSQAREAAASIRSIDLGLTELVGEDLLAELWPTHVAVAGRVDTFEVFIQTHFVERPVGSRSEGFDEMQLVMPSGVPVDLLGIDVGVDSQTGAAKQEFHPSGVDGIFVDDEGEELQVLTSSTDSIRVRWSSTINILPRSEAERTYNAITAAGDQVPVDHEAQPLSAIAYGALEEEEQGDILYFRQTLLAGGGIRLTKIDTVGEKVPQLIWGELEEEERGPRRYFRVLLGDGAQFPFGVDGDSLDATGHRRLSQDRKGTVVGAGPEIRVRFAAPVFRNGTTLAVAVRNAAGGGDPTALWQDVEAGDASKLREGNTLSISLPLETRTIELSDIAPNPFSPNGDGINDETLVHMNILDLSAGRRVEMRIYQLDGTRVYEKSQMVGSGRAVMPWDGTDTRGRRVLPGIYICQIRLETDSGDVTLLRSIAVAY